MQSSNAKTATVRKTASRSEYPVSQFRLNDLLPSVRPVLVGAGPQGEVMVEQPLVGKGSRVEMLDIRALRR